MRILLFTKLLTLPPFVDVVLELAGRDVEVVIASPTDERERDVDPELLDAHGVSFIRYEELSDRDAGRAAEILRRARDYAWYLGPEHRIATFNRQRALDRFAEVALRMKEAPASWPDPILDLDPEAQAALDAALAAMEAQLEPDPGIVELLASHRPDAVLITPLIRSRLHQTEVVKAARTLGIPSGMLAYSWDSLSNKGRLQVEPDRVYVWNEIHRREAVDLHGVEPDRVVVTGAAQWDRFFASEPSVTREELAAAHGFDPEAPIVLYLGSTRTVCPDEPPVITRWLDAIRNSSGPLRDANVLIRRHPRLGKRSQDWLDRVPKGPRVSISDPRSKRTQSLFDELHHAAVAVGLNTSAQIEASILGKPVYTFSAGVAAPGQEGTLHFYNLLEQQGGVVKLASTLGEHVTQLERGLAGEVDHDAIRRFCERVVRPHGLDRPVAPMLAEELLRLPSLRR
jgi:hypothetical protein